MEECRCAHTHVLGASHMVPTSCRNDPLLEIAMELERVATHDQYFVQRGLYPNVDFYSGIVLRALGVGRSHSPAQSMAGWPCLYAANALCVYQVCRALTLCVSAADPSLHVYCAVCCRAHCGLGERSITPLPLLTYSELTVSVLSTSAICTASIAGCSLEGDGRAAAGDAQDLQTATGEWHGP